MMYFSSVCALPTAMCGLADRSYTGNRMAPRRTELGGLGRSPCGSDSGATGQQRKLLVSVN